MGTTPRSQLARQRPLSPYSNTILGFYVQPVPGHNVEGLIPTVDIAYSVTSIFPRRVSISCDLLPQRCFALNLPPSLGKRQEKPLFPAQSTDYDVGLAFEGENVGVVSDEYACQISNAFAQDLFAVDAEIALGTIGV